MSAQLRRQRRQVWCVLSAFVLVVTVGAGTGWVPPWVLAGALVWVLTGVVLGCAWMAAVEVGHWWTRRRREQAFARHVADVLAIVRDTPVEDRPEWGAR